MDSKKIKLVHIAQANGGVEMYLRMFIKYSNIKKYKNYLILSQQYEESKKYFEDLGAKVFIVEMTREISPINDLKSMKEIYCIIKDINPQIVYTHSSKAGGLGRIPAKLNKGIKSVYNPHGWAFDMKASKKKTLIFKYIEKILSCFTDNVVAISEYEKKIAINNKILNKSKITVIENAIDLENVYSNDDRAEILKSQSWDNTCLIIGMIARLSEQKSPHTFIDIGIELLKRYPNCRFIMVGDGELRDEVEKRISEKELKDKFYITGWVNNPNRYLKVFDVAILTSIWEGFGLVIPEYMSAKKPVVASNVGGIANIIENGKDGYLVSDGDVSKFVKYISMLLDNDDIRNNIVRNAFEKVQKKYDFKRVLDEHSKLFETKTNKI